MAYDPGALLQLQLYLYCRSCYIPARLDACAAMCTCHLLACLPRCLAPLIPLLPASHPLRLCRMCLRLCCMVLSLAVRCSQRTRHLLHVGGRGVARGVGGHERTWIWGHTQGLCIHKHGCMHAPDSLDKHTPAAGLHTATRAPAWHRLTHTHARVHAACGRHPHLQPLLGDGLLQPRLQRSALRLRQVTRQAITALLHTGPSCV